MKPVLISVIAAVIVGILSIILSRNPFSREDIVAELGPLLSPQASIVLPTENATLFKQLTKRHFEFFHPDVTAVITGVTEADVSVIVKYAKGKNRKILAGNCLHGWGTSLNSTHNAIMIRINTLSTISIDTSTNTMTVGGGVNVGDVVASLHAVGKETDYYKSLECAIVLASSATLGGVYGHLQGLRGLIADNLISVRIVTSNGDTITASNSSHPDLFWGLRGAGHNFGIITEAFETAFNHIPHLSRTETVLPWDRVNSLGAMGAGALACPKSDPNRKNGQGVSLMDYNITSVRKLYDLYVDFLITNPTALGTILIFESYAAQAVQAVDVAATAYPHREARNTILMIAGYPNATLDAVAISWLETATSLLHSTSGFQKLRVYLNYAQGNEDFGARYGYEEWRQVKLKELKKRYDPDDTFSGYHPIPRD